MKEFGLKNLRHVIVFGLLLGLLKLMRLLGIEKARRYSSFLARKLGPFTYSNKIIHANLKYVYPGISLQ